MLSVQELSQHHAESQSRIQDLRVALTTAQTDRDRMQSETETIRDELEMALKDAESLRTTVTQLRRQLENSESAKVYQYMHNIYRSFHNRLLHKIILKFWNDSADNSVSNSLM